MSLIQHPSSSVLLGKQSQSVNLIQQAQSRITNLLEWFQQNNLPAQLTVAKKYQIYAQTLMEGLQAVSQESESLIYNMQPLQADYSVLVGQMHKYANEEIASRAPALEVFARAQGDEITNRLLFVLIKKFTESVNIKQKLTVKQTVAMASMVQVDFRDLSLTDVLLCLRNTQSGKYGQLYESFDFVKLGEFLRKYRQEKESLREQKHKDLKYSQSSILYDIVSNLDKAPEQFREPFQSLSAQKIVQSLSTEQEANAAPTNRPQLGIDLDAVFAETGKPASRLPRPKQLTETENRQRIMAELTLYMDHMSEEEYLYYVDYYETYRQPELVEWLKAEWKKVQEKQKTKAS
ncbi:hypothetical protein QNI19_35995 [Cytophagaceae bacterium DM2B3-1]|uniref:Uncharacterized protein n=1 Tax=Xanthocytophaga flava TaxID=3048013 RepID=A0ABT7CX94_9BACT|nr:hypothetical protein [Xanthocytophaga flavus]MDJ1498393.1 hypothetical protein [Xanthocytophaga flavus]